MFLSSRYRNGNLSHESFIACYGKKAEEGCQSDFSTSAIASNSFSLGYAIRQDAYFQVVCLEPLHIEI